jgi:hypothetical protein
VGRPPIGVPHERGASTSVPRSRTPCLRDYRIECGRPVPCDQARSGLGPRPADFYPTYPRTGLSQSRRECSFGPRRDHRSRRLTSHVDPIDPLDPGASTTPQPPSPRAARSNPLSFPPVESVATASRVLHTAQRGLRRLHVQVEPTATVLSGALDQAALHGLITRVRALGLELVDVYRVRPRP